MQAGVLLPTYTRMMRFMRVRARAHVLYCSYFIYIMRACERSDVDARERGRRRRKSAEFAARQSEQQICAYTYIYILYTFQRFTFFLLVFFFGPFSHTGSRSPVNVVFFRSLSGLLHLPLCVHV